MNLNTRYKYSSKWDRIPPQADKVLTDPHHGVNRYTDHLEMLQDIAYTRDVYKHIGTETVQVWLSVLGLKGNMENALYGKWFRNAWS
jgi:hypothetical protein